MVIFSFPVVMLMFLSLSFTQCDNYVKREFRVKWQPFDWSTGDRKIRPRHFQLKAKLEHMRNAHLNDLHSKDPYHWFPFLGITIFGIWKQKKNILEILVFGIFILGILVLEIILGIIILYKVPHSWDFPREPHPNFWYHGPLDLHPSNLHP